jgi:glycosyltransferase involved in cell wall biosynthesis
VQRDPGFAARVAERVAASGLVDRVRFTGPLTGRDLDLAYAGTDLLVSASRSETYGMVLTEALARGLPVVAAAVGGVPEALGDADPAPGLLVPTDDSLALAEALATWLADAALRERLRLAARRRRESLRPWSATTSTVAGVLQQVAA